MTAVFREAAKKCASAMGLEYVEDADLLTTNATKKHFGFVMQDAFVSSGDQLLDMRKMDLLNQEQHQERVRQLMKCGAGVLVMDNLFYASPLVQSRMMGLVEKGRFDEQDSASVTLGITGNRSALDDLDMHRVAVPWEVRFDHFLVDGEQASAKDECVPLYSGVPNKDGKDGDRRLAVTEEKSGPSPADYCMDGLADRIRALRDNLGTGARTHEQISNKQPPEMGMTAARNKPF